jgi:hypothetical protein
MLWEILRDLTGPKIIVTAGGKSDNESDRLPMIERRLSIRMNRPQQ